MLEVIKSLIKEYYSQFTDQISQRQRIKFFSKLNDFRRFYTLSNLKINRQLVREVKSQEFDLVFLAKADTINYKNISKLSKRTKTWYFFMDPLSTAFKVKAHKYAVNSTFSSATFSSINNLFKKKGTKSFFITEGFDADIYHPSKINVEKKYDVIFVGTATAKRKLFIEFLRENGVKIVCFGKGWGTHSVYLDQLAEKYREAKIILNFTRGKVGFSDRLLLAMGTGSMVLTEYCTDAEKLFKKGKHLDWFKNRNELIDLINFYLKNADLREDIAESGAKFVHKNYTWKNITRKILEKVS
mgnify:FL=1